MKHQYFKQNIETMESNFVFKIKTFDRQAVIDDIDYLIRQLKITKEEYLAFNDNQKNNYLSLIMLLFNLEH